MYRFYPVLLMDKTDPFTQFYPMPTLYTWHIQLNLLQYINVQH